MVGKAGTAIRIKPGSATVRMMPVHPWRIKPDPPSKVTRRLGELSHNISFRTKVTAGIKPAVNPLPLDIGI